MKSFLSSIFFISVVTLLTGADKTVFQCPMHPWINSEVAGDKCTICGMALVAQVSSASSSDDPNLVKLSPASASVVGVEIAEVKRGSLIRTLRVTGIVEADHTNHRILAARVPGRIESLGVKHIGAEVKAGAPLATMFSPEMLTAQREYVEQLKGGEAFAPSDKAAALERLLELGLTEQEVNILEHTLEPVAMVHVRSPLSGTVISRFVYEGQYVDATDKLFEIADFSSMWFIFDVYEPDLAWLQVDQEVAMTVTSQPGRVYREPIAFIDPNLNETSRTARVRTVLPNRDRKLLHKQTGEGQVKFTLPNLLLVPRSAVLQHGADPIVYVAQDSGGFLARHIQLGRIGDSDAEVISGLQVGERVVSSGGLILDGQAQLAQAAITGTIHQHDHGGSTTPTETITPDDEGYALLKPLAFAAADAASDLAADDLAAYLNRLPQLQAALNNYLSGYAHASTGPLSKYETTLADPTDLRGARRSFEPLSSALADEVMRLHLHHREGLHIYECPMTPVLGHGRWISRSDELRNPFFGSAMLTCGDEIE